MLRGHSCNKSCRQFPVCQKERKREEKKQQLYTGSCIWTKAKHSLGNNQCRLVFIARNEGLQQGWPSVSELDTSITNIERWKTLRWDIDYVLFCPFTPEPSRLLAKLWKIRRLTANFTAITTGYTATFKLEMMWNISASFQHPGGLKDIDAVLTTSGPIADEQNFAFANYYLSFRRHKSKWCLKASQGISKEVKYVCFASVAFMGPHPLERYMVTDIHQRQFADIPMLWRSEWRGRAQGRHWNGTH